MPYYEYKCECGMLMAGFFRMGEASATIFCRKCGGNARRIFSIPRLTTQPDHLKDENKFWWGTTSEKDKADIQRQDAKDYDAAHQKTGPGYQE